jgi:hypothetical protein
MMDFSLHSAEGAGDGSAVNAKICFEENRTDIQVEDALNRALGIQRSVSKQVKAPM